MAGLKHRIGTSVWGVVWEIPEEELSMLDEAEGYHADRAGHFNSYNRVPCIVWRDGDQLLPERVNFYDAVPSPDAAAPSAAYLELVLEGAKQHALPLPYIEMIAELMKNGV